ncbi:MAG: ABC transporter permease [Rubrobacteraceae bacterium]|uniref:ABC transporter permease n=1 Tax=Rubrobacter naiadicus TaxID=1392641 RepID=UPI00235EC067|nr:ABC transporter permease [Rubrobacter naiadicus]MCL6439775.1 ABC transporter permease [Rubrobacteraceae bacterium]
MAQTATADERVRQVGFLRRWLTRPELAAVAGAVLVFAFFAIVAGDSGFLTLGGAASYLEVAAQLGVVTVPVSLLMIAGEFDLSVGSMVGAAGMLIALGVTQFGWPLWLSIAAAIVFAALVGLFNGYVVIKTRLHSFIVTLGMLFALRGLTIGFTRLITSRTQIGGLDSATHGSPLRPIFAGTVGGFPVSIIWWLVLAAIGTWVLQRTVFGNWTFGAGGDPDAARNVGVPVDRVKITLFVCTAVSAALLAAIQVLAAGSADVLRGENLELQAIAASVIGGVLLTGGYGSVVGALFGALIFGMVQQGIFFTGVNTDWFLVFVGVMLLVAVLFNNYIRKRASEAR